MTKVLFYKMKSEQYLPFNNYFFVNAFIGIHHSQAVNAGRKIPKINAGFSRKKFLFLKGNLTQFVDYF